MALPKTSPATSIRLGNVTFEDRGAVHHREARLANVVFCGDLLAGEEVLGCAFDGADGAFVVPGVRVFLLGLKAVATRAGVANRRGELDELIQGS